MLNQFSRTQLLLGADNMDRLSNAKVAVFGIGGVGGYVAGMLARAYRLSVVWEPVINWMHRHFRWQISIRRRCVRLQRLCEEN